MRKVGFLWLIILILIAGLVVSNGICQKETFGKKDYYNEIELFANALSTVQSNYVDEPDPKKMIHGALNGMLSSLDQYSQFMDQDAYNERKVETEGEYGGLGIEIAIKDGLLTIISPIEGTPAAKVGIMPGDRVVRIDGKSTKDIT